MEIHNKQKWRDYAFPILHPAPAAPFTHTTLYLSSHVNNVLFPWQQLHQVFLSLNGNVLSWEQTCCTSPILHNLRNACSQEKEIMGTWTTDFWFKSVSLKDTHKIPTETVSQGNVKSLNSRYLHCRESLLYMCQASKDHAWIVCWML